MQVQVNHGKRLLFPYYTPRGREREALPQELYGENGEHQGGEVPQKGGGQSVAQAPVAAGPKVDGYGIEGGLRGGGEHRGHLAGWAVGTKALEQIQGVGGSPAAGDGPQ